MDDGIKARCIIFDDPKGEPTSFDLFKEFVEKMKSRNTTGISITINGKEYAYQVKDYKPKNQ